MASPSVIRDDVEGAVHFHGHVGPDSGPAIRWGEKEERRQANQRLPPQGTPPPGREAQPRAGVGTVCPTSDGASRRGGPFLLYAVFRSRLSASFRIRASNSPTGTPPLGMTRVVAPSR